MVKNSILSDGLGSASLFARSHPVINFFYFAIVICITMFSVHPAFLLLSFVLSTAYSVILKGKKALVFDLTVLLSALVLMTLFNTLTVHNGVTVLFYLNGNRITLEAIVYGMASAVMLASSVIWFSCLSAVITADKFIYLFGRIAPSVALMLSMILRYIPLLQNRYREISAAQRCMGRGKAAGGFVSRIRQYAKELSILIAWSLEASIESSDSMEARGYGLRGRTSFHLFKFARREAFLLSFVILLGVLPALACIMGETSIYYYPAIILPPLSLLQGASLVSYSILMLCPMVMDIKEAVSWK